MARKNKKNKNQPLPDWMKDIDPKLYDPFAGRHYAPVDITDLDAFQKEINSNLPYRAGTSKALIGDSLDEILQNLLHLDNQSDDQYADALKNYIERLTLKEQRAYDDPTAQVLRLMQTGMSRDQAISMLSSAGSTASSVGSMQVSSPSESQLLEAQEKAQQTETALNASSIVVSVIGTALSAITSGYSALAAGVAAGGMQIGNAINKKKLEGFQEASDYAQLISTRINSGFYGDTSEREKIFGSVDSLNAYNAAVTQEQDPELYDYMHTRFPKASGNLAFHSFFNDAFNDRWNTHNLKPTSRLLKGQMDAVVGQGMAAMLQPELITSQIRENEASVTEINESVKMIAAQIANINQQTTNLEAENSLIQANISNVNASTNQIKAATELLAQDAILRNPSVQATIQNMQPLTAMECTKISLQTAMFANLKPDQLSDYMAQSMMNDAEARASYTKFAATIEADKLGSIENLKQVKLEDMGEQTAYTALLFEQSGALQAVRDYWSAVENMYGSQATIQKTEEAIDKHDSYMNEHWWSTIGSSLSKSGAPRYNYTTHRYE